MNSHSNHTATHEITNSCSYNKIIFIVAFGITALYFLHPFVSVVNRESFIDIVEFRKKKSASPLQRTLGFIRWNKPYREHIPLMEKYQSFFAQLHYSLPNYTTNLDYKIDGFAHENTPYYAVSEVMKIILQRYPSIEGLLYFHFDTWIRPFRFDDIDYKKIWFPVRNNIPFLCEPSTSVRQWDMGLLHNAQNFSSEVIRIYIGRFVIDKTVFCRSWSDIYYIPRRFFNDFIDLSDISYTINLFHEIAIPTMINIIDLSHRLTPFHTVIAPLSDCFGQCCSFGTGPNELVERRCGHRIDLSNATIRKSFADVLDLENAFLKKLLSNQSTFF
ncbi:hypothetical protein I4U23_013321 [Adineta vaga]|nr:hypothetical protein I4U23_013321 [Adineta vaga]